MSMLNRVVIPCLCLLVVLASCDRRANPAAVGPANTAPTAATTSPPVTSATIRSPAVLPPGYTEYRRLATALCDPLAPSTASLDPHADLSELYAAANGRLLEYRDLQMSNAKIATLAKEAAEAQDDFLRTHRQLYRASDSSGNGLLMLVGILAGNPPMAFSGFQGAVSEEDARGQLQKDFALAFQRNRGAQLTLISMAPDYAGSDTVAGALSTDLDESWAGVTTPYDVLKLTNRSGKLLHDCVLEVTLTGKDGSKQRNVHFLPEWANGQVCLARYGIGVKFGGQVLGQQTVYGVQTVKTRLWCKELRSESSPYLYPGAEKDADVRALLDGALKLNYRIYDSGIVNVVPTLALSLEGIKAVPSHTVTIEFLHGKDRITKAWTNAEWHQGQERIFKPDPRLPWQPEELKITLTFPDTSYAWIRTVKIKR